MGARAEHGESTFSGSTPQMDQHLTKLLEALAVFDILVTCSSLAQKLETTVLINKTCF